MTFWRLIISAPPPLKNKFFVTVSNTIGFIVLSDEHWLWFCLKTNLCICTDVFINNLTIVLDKETTDTCVCVGGGVLQVRSTVGDCTAGVMIFNYPHGQICSHVFATVHPLKTTMTHAMHNENNKHYVLSRT